MFFDGNDFRDTYLGPEKYDVSTGGARWRKECLERIPVEFRSGEETKEIPRTVRQLLWDHLASYRLLSQSKSRILADWSGEARAQGASEFRVERRFLSYTFWSQVPYPEVAVESKNLSIEVFGRIHASLLSRNVRLAIVAVPFREHVYTAHEQGEGYDIRRPAVFVEDFAREHGIPISTCCLV